MFHVYGVGGRLYSGGADNIPVVPVQRLERLDTVHSFIADERVPEEPQVPEHPRNLLSTEAVAAYTQAGQSAAPTRLPRAVSQVMTSTVVTVQADATLVEAARWLAGEGVGQAPVIDEHQQLIGLLGRAQILAGVTDPHQPVRAVMVSPVPAALPDTNVHHVARVLVQTGLPGLPVVDADGALCGFVARGDLLRVLAEEAALDAWS